MLSSEKKGCVWFWVASEELVSFMDSLGLQNLPFIGPGFTFFKSGSRDTRSRLDRFLVKDSNSGWSEEMMQ